jgi:hypothetical protein
MKIGAENWQMPPVILNYTEFGQVIQSRIAATAR